MREFGTPDKPKNRFEDVKINGEVFQIYSRVPATAVKKARDFAAYMQSALDTETQEIDVSRLDDLELYEKLCDALPHLLPEDTATEILARMSGEKAPIMEPDEVTQFALWLSMGMPDVAMDQVEVATGKVESGQKTSSRSASSKKPTRKSAAK